MRGLILEGVTGSGKTRILGHLQRRLAVDMPANTKVFLGEHYTERMLEHLREAGTLTPRRVLDHLGEIVDLLAPLQNAKLTSKFCDIGGNTTVLAIFERFLLGHIANMRMVAPDAWALTDPLLEGIAELYHRADTCGLQRAILRVQPDAMAERVLSTRQQRGVAWREYLGSHGDDAAIVARYEKWQRILLEYCEALEPVVKPVFFDIGADWDDARYAALADELQRRFFEVSMSASSDRNLNDEPPRYAGLGELSRRPSPGLLDRQ